MFLCVSYVKVRVVDDRKAVQQADRIGLPLKSDGRRTQTLTTEFIAEALTISDLFELNEVASVELLFAGYRRSFVALSKQVNRLKPPIQQLVSHSMPQFRHWTKSVFSSSFNCLKLMLVCLRRFFVAWGKHITIVHSVMCGSCTFVYAIVTTHLENLANLGNFKLSYGKVGHATPEHRCGAHLLVVAIELVGGQTTCESLLICIYGRSYRIGIPRTMHGQCNARPSHCRALPPYDWWQIILRGEQRHMCILTGKCTRWESNQQPHGHQSDMLPLCHRGTEFWSGEWK